MFRLAANGHPDAWRELTDRFGGLVQGIARRAGLGETDAADVAQLTWLRLLESIDRVRDPDCVSGWVATTARRESIRLSISSARQVPSADPTKGQHGYSSPGVDECRSSGEDVRAIHRALERLPVKYRQLFELLTSDAELSYAEVAAALGMPVGSIGPVRMRGIQILRRSPEFSGLGGWDTARSLAA